MSRGSVVSRYSGPLPAVGATRTLENQTRSASSVLPVSSFIRWLPMIVAEVFLNATVLLFAWCSWPINNHLIFYCYIGTTHALLACGYANGVRRARHCDYVGKDSRSWQRLLLIGLTITAITSPVLIYSTSGGSLDLTSGFLVPGDTYLESRFKISQGMGTNAVSFYIGQIRIIFGYFIFLVLPIGFLFWRKLKLLWRFCIIAAAAAHILESASAGVNRGIADIVIMLPWLVLFASTGSPSRSRRSKWLTVAVAAAVGLFLFAGYFSVNISQRMGSRTFGHFYTTDGELIVKLEPFQNAELNRLLNPIVGYCTQGYYGLSRSLELPFQWTYGVGNSTIFTTYAEKYLTEPDVITSRTYPARVERSYGWDAKIHWATAYVWLAGDVSFGGVLLFVYVIGKLLAITWREAIEARNPSAANLFVYLIVGVHYFPANNQLMQVAETSLGVWIAFLVWWIGRSRSALGIRSPLYPSRPKW